MENFPGILGLISEFLKKEKSAVFHLDNFCNLDEIQFYGKLAWVLRQFIKKRKFPVYIRKIATFGIALI